MLSPGTAAVLRMAAVGGTVLDEQLLVAVVDEPVTAVEAALREAVDRNVLVQHADRLAFRHSLLRDAVYEDLLPSQRSRLHARYADAVRDRTGMSHAELLCLAAEPVATAGDPERPQALLQQALDLIDVEKEPLLASRIYAVRADQVCAAVGDPKEQQFALDRAVAFAEGTLSPELAHALTVTASFLLVYYARCRDARRLGEQARTVSLAIGDDANGAKAAALVAVAQVFTGELDEGLADAQVAAERWERVGPLSDALLFRGLHAHALGAAGRPLEGIAVARRSGERAAALGLPAAAFYCAGADIFLSGRVGHLDEAEHRLASLLRGWQPGMVRELTRAIAGELWLRRGELANAATAFAEVRAWFTEADDLHAALGDLSPMVDLYLAQGEPDAAPCHRRNATSSSPPTTRPGSHPAQRRSPPMGGQRRCTRSPAAPTPSGSWPPSTASTNPCRRPSPWSSHRTTTADRTKPPSEATSPEPPSRCHQARAANRRPGQRP